MDIWEKRILYRGTASAKALRPTVPNMLEEVRLE